MAQLTFIPWTRSGAGGALRPSSSVTNRPNFDVSFVVRKTFDDGTRNDLAPMNVPMTMLGPGDVVGIKSTQVIRTDPTDGAAGIETTIFPTIEFAEPSLPWMFTPATENANNQLQPWICLVVVQ